MPGDGCCEEDGHSAARRVRAMRAAGLGRGRRWEGAGVGRLGVRSAASDWPTQGFGRSSDFKLLPRSTASFVVIWNKSNHSMAGATATSDTCKYSESRDSWILI